MSNLALIKPQAVSTLQKGLVVCKNTLIKQSPIILAGIGIGGVVTTSILAAKATIRAKELVDEARKEKADGELTLQESVQAGWKPYVPAVISGVLTVGAIVASTTISQKRQTALAGLYAVSEAALKEYQDKIESRYGTKEAQEIKDGLNATRVEKAGVPPWDDSVLPVGDVLCFDKFTGRYFSSSVQKIQSAENEINRMIYGGDMCASLNEFYGLIDSKQLPQCSIGESVGWNLDTNCKVYFTSCLTSDMKPCLVLDYANGHEPTALYRDI